MRLFHTPDTRAPHTWNFTLVRPPMNHPWKGTNTFLRTRTSYARNCAFNPAQMELLDHSVEGDSERESNLYCLMELPPEFCFRIKLYSPSPQYTFSNRAWYAADKCQQIYKMRSASSVGVPDTIKFWQWVVGPQLRVACRPPLHRPPRHRCQDPLRDLGQ